MSVVIEKCNPFHEQTEEWIAILYYILYNYSFLINDNLELNKQAWFQ